MKINKCALFSAIFQVVCILISLGLAGFWTYKFSLNEDISKVEYKEFFKDLEDVYPLMTLCFRNPFINAYKDHMLESDRLNLEKMMSGNISVSLEHFDYDNRTFHLSEYVTSYYIRWRNGSTVTYPSLQYKWNHVYESYSGLWREEFYKCFSLENPNNQVAAMSILVSNEVFPNGTRPLMFDFFCYV